MKKILRHGRFNSNSTHYDPIIYSIGAALIYMPDTSTLKKTNANFPKEPHSLYKSLDYSISANRFVDIDINSYWQNSIYTLSSNDLNHFSVKVQITNGEIDDSMTEFYLQDESSNFKQLTTWISVKITSTSSWTFSICYDDIEIVRASGTLTAT